MAWEFLLTLACKFPAAADGLSYGAGRGATANRLAERFSVREFSPIRAGAQPHEQCDAPARGRTADYAVPAITRKLTAISGNHAFRISHMVSVT
jgi:hypothetical protein